MILACPLLVLDSFCRLRPFRSADTTDLGTRDPESTGSTRECMVEMQGPGPQTSLDFLLSQNRNCVAHAGLSKSEHIYELLPGYCCRASYGAETSWPGLLVGPTGFSKGRFGPEWSSPWPRNSAYLPYMVQVPVRLRQEVLNECNFNYDVNVAEQRLYLADILNTIASGVDSKSCNPENY